MDRTPTTRRDPDPLVAACAARRRELQITKVNMADELDVAVGTLNSWESGARRPSIDQVRHYVDKLAELSDSRADVEITWSPVDLVAPPPLRAVAA